MTPPVFQFNVDDVTVLIQLFIIATASVLVFRVLDDFQDVVRTLPFHAAADASGFPDSVTFSRTTVEIIIRPRLGYVRGWQDGAHAKVEII